MNAGKLQNRIAFYTYGKAQDGFGGYTVAESLNDTVWGHAKETSGEVVSRDGGRQTQKTTELIIRKKTYDIIKGNEIGFKVDGGTMHRVTNVYEYEIDKYMKLIGIKIST